MLHLHAAMGATSDLGNVSKQDSVKMQYKLAGAAFTTRLRAIKDVGTLTK
jgi:hypothetical protein